MDTDSMVPMLEIGERKILTMANTFRTKTSGLWVSIPLVALLLVMVPFGSALAVHHDFAEVDHDGHRHSDFDLCKWVEQHASSSFCIQPIVVEAPFPLAILQHDLHSALLPNSLSLSTASPRGPPLS